MLEIAMSQEQRVDFLTNASSFAVVGNAIRKLDASRATATRPADIAMIFGMIEEMEGGVARLNATVKENLIQWVTKEHASAMGEFLRSAAGADTRRFTVSCIIIKIKKTHTHFTLS